MSKDKLAKVFHAELWGLRQQKYAWLNQHEKADTRWQLLQPQSPFYLFVPRDTPLQASYDRFIALPHIFPVNSVGIVTARDSLTIQWSPDEVWKTVTVFSQMDPDLARKGYELGKDARDWKVTLAQKDLLDSGLSREKIVPVLYRPFDVRYTYYTGRSRGFICMPRPEVMRHMLAGGNVALMIPKRVEHLGTWQHAFVCNVISDHVAVSFKTIDYNFPLYLYPDANPHALFAHHEPSEPRPNLNPKVVEALAAAYGRAPSPEQIFNYVYAVLYAPAYRQKYAEFLRMDFPRIPFTADPKLFKSLASFGERLVALHLLKSSELDPPAARFQGKGDARVAKGKAQGFGYDPTKQRVCINKTQYFAPVPPEVWEYQVGGYQVCEKWLKDRRERTLNLDDIRTYCRIVTALKATIQIQKDIDALYPSAEARTVPFSSDSNKP